MTQHRYGDGILKENGNITYWIQYEYLFKLGFGIELSLSAEAWPLYYFIFFNEFVEMGEKYPKKDKRCQKQLHVFVFQFLMNSRNRVLVIMTTNAKDLSNRPVHAYGLTSFRLFPPRFGYFRPQGASDVL